MPVVAGGIVDENSDRTGLSDNRIDCLPDSLDIAQICLEEMHRVLAVTGQAQGKRAALVLGDVDEGDLGALTRETLDDGRADARSAAGHQNRPIPEFRKPCRYTRHRIPPVVPLFGTQFDYVELWIYVGLSVKTAGGHNGRRSMVSRKGTEGENDTGTPGKLMVLLDLVTHAERPLRFTDILAQAGQPRGTLHRQLGHLVEEGLLELDADGRYSPGLRLLDLAARSWAKNEFRLIAEPHLRALQAMSGETVHLGVLRGTSIIYLDKVEGQQSVRMNIRETSDAGTPLVASEPNGIVAGIYKEIAAKVWAEVGGQPQRAAPAIVFE